MAKNTISIDNIVNAISTFTPELTAPDNVNNIGLFTHEPASFIGDYKVYDNYTNVEKDFGTSSITTSIASKIFSQTPNITSTSAKLIIMPLITGATSATNAKITTANILANLTNFQAVSDGSIEFVVDGITKIVINLNFTQANTLEQIAEIFNNATQDYLSVENVGNTLIFKSKKYGTSSSVVINADLTGTDLTVATLLNTATATTTAGINSTGETIQDAITRIGSNVFYVPCMTTLDLEDDKIQDIADAIQPLYNTSSVKMFFTTFSSEFDLELTGLPRTLGDTGMTLTRCVYANSINRQDFLGAILGRFFTTSLEQAGSALTANLKELTGIAYDNISDDILTKCEQSGVLFYASLNGRTQGKLYELSEDNTNAVNEFTDLIYNDILIRNDIRYSLFNLLEGTLTKISQTENGAQVVLARVREVMIKAVKCGIIAEGLDWTSPNTFGDPKIFKDNIKKYGFYIYSIPISQQNPIERVARQFPTIKIAYKCAGAVHKIKDIQFIIER